jgi:TolB-like protein/tetratricopeptide (TPR) repeat protein
MLGLRALLTDSSISSGGVLRRRRSRSTALAVLPFGFAGSDATAEYLADGLTESIINSLSQLPKLRVVPRSSVFRYKGREVDVQSTGLALNAGTLVTGRVVQHGDMLNIQVDMIDVATESQVWGDRYRHPAADIFTVQEEIAWQISEALRIRLTGAQKQRLRRRPTQSGAAYHSYLRGRYHWHKWTGDDFRKAVAAFEEAIDEDPEYALAYAGLSDAFGAMGYYGHLEASVAMPRAIAAARRALEIDPKLGEAHATMGMGAFFYEWDWQKAEASFRRGVELSPRYSIGHALLALFLCAMRRYDEAFTHARTAVELDPLSPFIQATQIWVHHFAGHFEEALRHARMLLDMEPNFQEARLQSVGLLERLGRFERAAEALDEAGPGIACLGPGGTGAVEAFKQGGVAGYWQYRIEMLRQMRNPGAPDLAFAVAYAQAGNLPAALEHAERMVTSHAPHAVFMAVESFLAPLRGEPRFQQLVRQIGLPAAEHDPHAAPVR